MFELPKTEQVEELIKITKSDSGISGPKLAEAHMKLGRMLAKHMPFLPEETTVVAILRGGIFFAEGIYFELGCKFQLFDPEHDVFERPDSPNVILVDSVINTGKTIKQIIKPDMQVACCVINKQSVDLFKDQLYTVRISDNAFVGTRVKKQKGNVGPDTTLRLFNDI